MDYSVEPAHSTSLIVRGTEPFNAEASVVALIQQPVTPEELVYCRNHSPTKPLDASTFRLKVEGEVENELLLTLADLKQSFPCVEVVAALQCAGNRRKTMMVRSGKGVEGIKWDEGAICNCRWAGARLRDVLLRAGVKPHSQASGAQMYASFASRVAPSQDDEQGFGASIELSKAMDLAGDVLIAYEMNGKPLTVDRGAPFRMVVPGYSGARWVKWLDTITISQCQIDNFYQQRDYKVLPPTVLSHAQADCENWWNKVPPIISTPLNSVIGALVVQPTTPPAAYPPARTSVLARGYAVAGATGGQVRAVEVSADGGASWHPARITYQDGRWSWTLWEALVVLDPDREGAERTVWCRATAESGETQKPECDWNLRGVAYCGYGQARF